MKFFSFIFLFVFILSCEDNVTEPTTTFIDRPTICPDIPDANTPSPFKFEGILEVQNISKTTATLIWNDSSDFVHYTLFQIQKFERTYITTILSPNTSYQLTGLTPDTEYSFILRAMDKNGKIDFNDKIMTFKTLPWPNFINQKSIDLNGAQSLSLSNFQVGQDISFSLWAKTPTEFSNDKRLITLHKGLVAGSTLSLGLKDKHIILFYQDETGKLKSIGKEFVYNDNLWHQYILSLQNNILTIYIDGNQFFKKRISLNTTIDSPLYIGAYAGIQKAFIGKIDELAIFNSSLTASQVTELYNDGRSQDLKIISFNQIGLHWFQFGDHQADTGAVIQDNFGNAQLSGLNLAPENINLDSP